MICPSRLNDKSARKRFCAADYIYRNKAGTPQQKSSTFVSQLHNHIYGHSTISDTKTSLGRNRLRKDGSRVLRAAIVKDDLTAITLVVKQLQNLRDLSSLGCRDKALLSAVLGIPLRELGGSEVREKAIKPNYFSSSGCFESPGKTKCGNSPCAICVKNGTEKKLM